MRLLDDTAAGRWVVSAHFVLVAVDVVAVSVALPLVLHLGDGDQLHCLPLGGWGWGGGGGQSSAVNRWREQSASTPEAQSPCSRFGGL